MQLAILTAVLAALAAAESGGGPVAGVAWRLAAIAGAILIAPAAALAGSWRLGKASEGARYDERALASLQSVVVGLWLSTALVVLFVAEWPRIIRANWHLAGWPLLDELAILTPVIAPLLLMWAALYRVERAVQVAAYRARNLVPPAPQLAGYLWLHVRHHLGLVLLPALAIVGVFDVLVALRLTSGNSATTWWFAMPLLATMLLLLPLAVRRIWPTTPLAAGPLHDQLQSICRELRCPIREILVWQTGGYLANAAVVGLVQPLRYVLLTDVLLARLSAGEIAAVLRHELAHLRRRHLPLRLALLALPLVWWLALERHWPHLPTALETTVAAAGLSPSLVAALALPALMLAYALVVVGWLSRLLEHEADLAACQTASGAFDPLAAADFCRALIKVIGRSRESRAGQWLHPSLANRLHFLRRAADGDVAITLTRRLAIVRWMIAAGYVAALVLVCL